MLIIQIFNFNFNCCYLNVHVPLLIAIINLELFPKLLIFNTASPTCSMCIRKIDTVNEYFSNIQLQFSIYIYFIFILVCLYLF